MILIGWLVVFGSYVLTAFASLLLLSPFLNDRGTPRMAVEVGAVLMAVVPYAYVLEGILSVAVCMVVARTVRFPTKS